MSRRSHVQVDDVGRFALEVRIVGLHVPLESMRLQLGAPPRVADETPVAFVPPA